MAIFEAAIEDIDKFLFLNALSTLIGYEIVTGFPVICDET